MVARCSSAACSAGELERGSSEASSAVVVSRSSCAAGIVGDENCDCRSAIIVVKDLGGVGDE